jgi:Fic family protein
MTGTEDGDDGRRHRWPPVSYEERAWDPSQPVSGSRAQVRRHRGPYLAAVTAPVSRAPVDLTVDLATLCSDAASEVARFDAEMGGEIAPFTPVLLRSESAASSQIENLTASARAVAEAELGGRLGTNAAQVVGNVAAMAAATALADDLSPDALLRMHEVLLSGTDPHGAGRWRDEQVWIGGSSLGPHAADFVPPHHDRVAEAIEDLVGFVDRDDIPVLAHAALAHAQFETIHPFTDGNGRTGRALVHAMLRAKGLTRNVTVPLSAGLLVDTGAYFDALTAYRRGSVDEIVTRFADAAFAAVDNGRALVADLRDIRAGWDGRVTARRGSAAWRLADLVVRRPVLDVASVAAELRVARQNVYRTVEPLVAAGVLTPSGRGQKLTWRADEVLAAVDAFATRAGRRRRA